MWVFVRDNLHQHLRKDKLGSAPFSVAKMPQYLRKQEDDMPSLYRSSTEQPSRVATKPFAQRRLRPGEEKLVAESKIVFLSVNLWPNLSKSCDFKYFEAS